MLVYGSYIQRCQIWVQAGNGIWQLLLWWCECWYMGHTYRGAKSGCKMLTLFDSYSYDGWVLVYGSFIQVPNLVARWWRFLTVIWWHMNLCTVAHLWSMNIFGFDKLWGPSQRVVTLFHWGLFSSCQCFRTNRRSSSFISVKTFTGIKEKITLMSSLQ